MLSATFTNGTSKLNVSYTICFSVSVGDVFAKESIGYPISNLLKRQSIYRIVKFLGKRLDSHWHEKSSVGGKPLLQPPAKKPSALVYLYYSISLDILLIHKFFYKLIFFQHTVTAIASRYLVIRLHFIRFDARIPDKERIGSEVWVRSSQGVGWSGNTAIATGSSQSFTAS